MKIEKTCLENLLQVISTFDKETRLNNIPLKDLKNFLHHHGDDIFKRSAGGLDEYKLKHLVFNLENLCPEVKLLFEKELFNKLSLTDYYIKLSEHSENSFIEPEKVEPVQVNTPLATAPETPQYKEDLFDKFLDLIGACFCWNT